MIKSTALTQVEVATWKIIGIKPLIQSNPQEMWKTPEVDDENVRKPTRKKGLRGTDSEQFLIAKKQLYVNDEGLHYHPAQAFRDALYMACDGRTLGKTPALTVITRAVTLIEDEFILYDPETLGARKPKPFKGKEWQIDYRRGINWNKNKSEGGVAVACCRPKWKRWGGFLRLEVDMQFFASLDPITELLNIGGHNFGVAVGRMRIKAMDYRKPIWSGFGSGKFTAELMG